jgi:glyoxylase I family protein
MERIGRVSLDHASIMTTDLSASSHFYSEMLGLDVAMMGDDPLRPGRKRAMLRDGDGNVVLELMAMPEMAHPTIPGRGGIHHLGFRLDGEGWRALRARLDLAAYPYQEMGECLFVRDPDGLILEIEQD